MNALPSPAPVAGLSTWPAGKELMRHEPLPDCPQAEYPLRDRAYTHDQFAAMYASEQYEPDPSENEGDMG